MLFLVRTIRRYNQNIYVTFGLFKKSRFQDCDARFFFFFFHLGDVKCGNGSWPVVGKIVGCEIFDLLFHWFLSFIGMWLKTYFPCITVMICVSWKFRLEFGVTSVLISPNLSYNGSSVVLTLSRLLLSRLLLIIKIYESSWMEIWG